MNAKKKRKLHDEKLIIRVSAILCMVISLIELFTYIITGSQSLFVDGIYDWMDVSLLFVYIFLLPIIYKPLNERMPYGYTQLETVFIFIKVSLLIVATALIILNNIKLLFHGGNKVDTLLICKFEGVIFVICIIGFLTLKYLNQKVKSPMVQTEILTWKIDISLTFGTFAAFFVSHFMAMEGKEQIAHYVDPAVAILISLMMLPEPVEIFVRSIREIILRAPKEEELQEIRRISEECLKDEPYDITFYDVVQTGRKYWISLYITSSEGVYYGEQMQKINQRLYDRLSPKYEFIYVDLVPDISIRK